MIIGGDSLIGSSLAAYWRSLGRSVLTTTRRPERVTGNRLYLDLLKADEFKIPSGLGGATILAAAVIYEDCDFKPEARQINVVMIPALARRLMEQGLSVNFMSTVSVFAPEKAWPNEDEPPAPTIAYAAHKYEAERALLDYAERSDRPDLLSITRLGKVLAPSIRPLPAWFEAWRQGRVVRPFTDFFAAPMSLNYVTAALTRINDCGRGGLFHLSGAENISYADLAARLAEALGLPPELVAPIRSEEAGVKLYYAPPEAGLGYQRTRALTGLEPAPISELVSALVAYYNTKDAKES